LTVENCKTKNVSAYGSNRKVTILPACSTAPPNATYKLINWDIKPAMTVIFWCCEENKLTFRPTLAAGQGANS